MQICSYLIITWTCGVRIFFLRVCGGGARTSAGMGSIPLHNRGRRAWLLPSENLQIEVAQSTLDSRKKFVARETRQTTCCSGVESLPSNSYR